MSAAVLEAFNLGDSADQVATELVKLNKLTNRELLEQAFAVSYALALRSERTPRTVLDVLFQRMTEDDSWRIDVAPALKKGLGR